MKKPAERPEKSSSAEAIGIKVFAFIAGSEVQLARFLTETGMEQHTVRQAAQSPVFLRGVLDYVLQAEDLLSDVVEATSIPATDIAVAARAAVGGSGNNAASAKSGTERPKGASRTSLPQRPLFREVLPGEAA